MLKEKIGLCVGSGAARGYAAYPIIKELTNLNVTFDYVSGSSIGALIGAYYCLYGEIDTLLKSFQKISKKEWLKMMDMNNPKKSVIKGKKLKKFLQKNFFDKKKFSDLKIPLVIATTNLETRGVEYISKGLLIDAIMASVSIPGIFPPYKIEHKRYVDGGVRENLPYDILFKKGMDRIIGIDFNTNEKSNNIDYDNSFNILLNTFYMLLQTSKIYEKLGDKLFVFQPKFKGGVGTALQPYLIDDNFQSGATEFIKNKKKFLKWLNKK